MGAEVAPVGMARGSSVPAERSALAKVMWFGVLGVVSVVFGWVLSFYVFGTIFVTASSLNLPAKATPSQVSAALGPIFQSLSLLIPSVVAIGLVGSALLTMAFCDLTKVGNSMFSLPWKLMVVLMVGAVLAAGGVIPVFNDIPSIIAQAPTGSGTPSAAFFSAISSLIFAGFVASIGESWRLLGPSVARSSASGGGVQVQRNSHQGRSHFCDHTLLNFLAPIFILVGAYQARGRLSKPM